MGMDLIITEEQYKRLFEDIQDEGLEYTNTGNKTYPSINMHINHSPYDSDNIGDNNADTRIANYRFNILRDRGIEYSSLKEKMDFNKYSKKMMYQASIYAKSQGRTEFHIMSEQDIDKLEVSPRTKTILKKSRNTIIEHVIEAQQTNNYENLEQWIKKWFADKEVNDSVNNDMWNRAQNFKMGQKGSFGMKEATYSKGTIPGTDVNFIALFTITDFNFSDAIKHGNLRPNKYTKKIIGFDTENKIPITYDNSIPANVENNFSLNDNGVVNSGHEKKQYGYGDENYTSVTQFIDKSIMYAKYALNRESYSPQYIIGAPSSSNFNKYYAQALCRKLGTAEYIEDFYQRNLINFKNEKGIEIAEQMRKDGVSEVLVNQFINTMKDMANKELSATISAPVRNFVTEYSHVFSNIAAEHYGREKVNMKVLVRLILNFAYNMMIKNMQEINQSSEMSRYLMEKFMGTTKGLYGNDKYLMEEVQKRIHLKIGRRVFQKVLYDMWSIIQQMSQQLESTGYKLKFNQPFKVTALPKRIRTYLTDVYVVADKYFNENRQLFKRFTQANFLIIDEDINSGTTLKNAVLAIEDVMPQHNSSHILCLTNAYSGKGF